MIPLTVAAPAKVNLTLHITGKRDDGYHLLDSLVVFVDFGDRITAAPADDLSLTVTGPFAKDLEGLPDNIVTQAAHRLAALVGLPPKAALTLEKNLPVASGIGGGSADAAAALKILADLWGVKEKDLSALALSLGADVPVCLKGQAVNMSGVGEGLDPAPPLPPAWLVLVNPGVALSTPAVFKARQGGFSKPNPLTEASRSVADLAAALRIRNNDLTEASISLAPVIGEVLKALEGQEACLLARMSGSGATCFGLFGEGAAARKAAGNLSEKGWWSVAAPILSQGSFSG